MRPCAVCRRERTTGALLCSACIQSFDRSVDDGTIAGAIRWAATRARRFERRTAKVRQGRWEALVRRQKT